MSNVDFLLVEKAILQRFLRKYFKNSTKHRIKSVLPLDPGARAALLMA